MSAQPATSLPVVARSRTSVNATSATIAAPQIAIRKPKTWSYELCDAPRERISDGTVKTGSAAGGYSIVKSR